MGRRRELARRRRVSPSWSGRQWRELLVRDVMTKDLRFCFEDEDLDDVSEKMGEYKIRRLPVLSREKRLVGIISLGDPSKMDGGVSGKALSEISEPGGLHSQH